MKFNAHVAKQRRVTAPLAVGALLLAPLVMAAPAVASPDGDGVVINEIFTRGGSANQPFTHKFVELFNPTDNDVSLEGWSLQYRSSGNGGTTKANLAGTIPANGYYLVQGGANTPTGGPFGEELPAPDATSNGFQVAANAGILALVSSTTNVTLPAGDVTQDLPEDVIDVVGYGAAATVFEGATALQPPNLGSIERVDGADTDNNAADFVGADFPTPTNSAGETAGGPPPPAECDHVPTGRTTIAEVQGEGAKTPFFDCEVTTTGVVTAVYPVGGFNGAYIQTPGTGGEIDLETHTASHGIFVYGSNFANAVNIGDYVEVRGEATEYFDLTQITFPQWTVLTEEFEPVLPALIEWPATDEARERFEGMLIDPQGGFTVTNLHQAEMYGEIGLAFGDEPLRQPTEYARPGSAEAATIAADNSARGLRLDDGSTWNYTNFTQPNHNTPIPYLSHDKPVRVGAAVTFDQPVILDWRNENWKFQPVQQTVGEMEGFERSAGQIPSQVSFENTRTAAPNVDGNLKIGAFNVLNYFTDLGEDEVGCAFYEDRLGNPSSARGCSVRGAFNQENLDRQTSKIVAAINELSVDVLALQEVENTLHFPNGENAPAGVHARDAALATLVDELNADAGAGTWAYVPSPAEVPSDEDVIRNAFIYKPATVALVGESDILLDSPAFHNAREPLAQQFTLVGADGEAEVDADVVTLITTHLKSKGSGTGENADQGDGQGASVADRVKQVHAMADYVDELIDGGMSPNVFILGDLNSYTMEDPMVELYDRGYEDIGAGFVDAKTYSFDGMIGSLDHIMGNSGGMSLVVDAQIWSINAYESVALEYSRYNYNIAPLFQESPFRSSDHDPMVVGLELKVAEEPGDGDADADADGADVDADADADADADGTDVDADADADGADADADGADVDADADADGTDVDADADADADGADADADGADVDADADADGSGDTDGGHLEETGANALPLILVASTLLVAGAVLMVSRRRVE